MTVSIHIGHNAMVSELTACARNMEVDVIQNDDSRSRDWQRQLSFVPLPARCMSGLLLQKPLLKEV